LIIGGSYADYSGDHFGEVIWSRFAGNTAIRDRYYANDARKTDANAYAKLNYAVNARLLLFGDVQLRQVGYDFLGFDDELDNVTQNTAYTFFNPKAGVDWRVHEGGRLYASVAVANREPNRDDLTETTPESRPRSERLLDYEGGYERRNGRLALGLNAFYMDYTDQLVLTGELNDVGAALRTNVPRSYRTGLELTWASQLTERLIWKGNATWSRNRVLDHSEYVDYWDTGGQTTFNYAGSPIAYSPEWVAASEFGITFWNKAGKGRGDLTLITKYVGEQYLDNSGSDARKLDAYLVNDLRLNLSLLKLLGVDRIEVNLTVRNIFNELYSSNGWSYSYVLGGQRQEFVGLYPQAPTNVLGGVVVRF
jgi:iron complex outermembrane receptor protein